MTTLSVLDLAPVVQGSTVRQALHNSRDLAQHAERWGYNRFWLAEHHNMRGIASAATSVVLRLRPYSPYNWKVFSDTSRSISMSSLLFFPNKVP
jgi:hypothetical protein